jgi:hypothetical protein
MAQTGLALISQATVAAARGARAVGADAIA